MALTPEEARELAQLEAELGGASSAAPEVGGPSRLEKFGTGLKAAGAKASRGLVDTAAWLGSDYIGRPLKAALIKHGLAPSDANLAADKRAVDAAGGWGTAGQITGDIATQILPAAKLSQTAAQIGGRAAPFLANMSGDVATAVALAPDAEKVDAAKSAALGTAAGKVLSKTLGGPMHNMVTPDAKKLMDEGIGLSPGQMISGTGAGWGSRTMRGVEDAVGQVPLVGMPMKFRASAAVEDYNKRVLQDLVEPLGGSITKAGREGVEEAHDQFVKTFNEVTPNLYIDDSKAAQLVDDIIPELRKSDATINERVTKTIRNAIELDLAPVISRGNISGEEGYQLGKKLDYYTKKYQGSPSPDHNDLARGFGKLRDAWYDLLEPKVGADPAYKDIIQHIQQSRRKWYNFRDAAELTPEGVFTPAQVRKVNKGYSPDKLTDAAYHVLPGTLPRSNAGMNAIVHKLATPAGVSGTLGAASLGGGTAMNFAMGAAPYLAAGYLPYTKAGGKYLAEGATPLANALLRKVSANKKLTAEELEFATQLLTSQGTRSLRNDTANQE